MKSVADRTVADPEVAARKLVELANAFKPIQGGRIYIQKQRALPVSAQGRAGGALKSLDGWRHSEEIEGRPDCHCTFINAPWWRLNHSRI